MKAVLGLSATLAAFATVPANAAQATTEAQAPAAEAENFSQVRSREEAERLASEGRLVRVYVFPRELGGLEIPENVTFVTPLAAEMQARLTAALLQLVEAGQIDRMTVEPEYRGDSFVPARLRFRTWRETEPGAFNPTLEVW